MHEPFLRRATKADAEAITRIHISSMRAAMPYLPVIHTEQETLAYFTNVVMQEQEVWVAVREQEVEGFISFRAGKVEHLYVAPECQTFGNGSMLLQKAKDESDGRLELYVYLRNTGARSFYETNGFSCVEMSSGSDNEHREPDGLYTWRRPGTAVDLGPITESPMGDVDDLRAVLQDRWSGQMADLLNPDADQVKEAFSGGCPQFIEIGSTWNHLRMCLKCGLVGCCDSSPQTHGQLHWRESGHAVIRTIEPGEDWKFNYELNGYVT